LKRKWPRTPARCIPSTLAFSFQAGTEYRVPLDYGDVQKPVRTYDHQVLPNGKITFLKFQNQKIYIPFYLHPQQMDRFWENKEVTALWFMRYLTTHLTILKA